jgi:zinc and cadmium transporter
LGPGNSQRQHMTYIYIYASLLIISLISLIGIIFIFFAKKNIQNILLLLVSLSAGTLLGGAMLHLLPEALEHQNNIFIWEFVILGILLFFFLEKIVCWRHCHIISSKEHPHSLGIMNLIGDGLHNAIDGMIIAGSFMVSVPLGIAAAIAIVAHEIPQEIADFGVLLHAGYSRKKALIYNFFISLSAFVGATLVLLIGFKFENISFFVLPIAAGGFIYIAASDLMPELKKETSLKKSLLQLTFIVLGIAIMAGIRH